ncbi:MAG: TonB family protein [Acidobacteria bacterium]|nr:TonB family protein [Acidobacteriota bacterium]
MLEAMAWKSALVALCAWLAALLLGRRAASERHMVWVAAMAVMLLLPLMERSAPAVVVLDTPAFAAGPVVASAAITAGEMEPNADLPLRVWLGGALLIAAYQLIGLVLLARQRRHLRPFAGQASNVYLSERIRTPMTWGVFRPVIALPVEAASWTEERLRVVLLHEQAHIARHDFLTQMLAGAACAIYWFNPLVWIGAAAMRREREKACDDAVLRHGAKASDYAQHLLDLASGQRAPAMSVPMAQRTHLEGRIRAALNPSISRGNPSRRMRSALALVAACAVLVLVTVKTQAQPGSARLAGSVMDASKAVIPGAEVLLISKNGKEITRSGADGKYSFAGIPGGEYTVEVRARGFAVLSQSGIRIAETEARQLDLMLNVGKISETLTVTGKKPAVAAPAAVSGTPQRIRVGGNVQATKVLKMERPGYPQHLQQAGIEGTVLLEGVIGTEGNIVSLRSVNSLVNAELTKAAMDAVSQWRYQPTLLNGQPVEVITTITINYKLAE